MRFLRNHSAPHQCCLEFIELTPERRQTPIDHFNWRHRSGVFKRTIVEQIIEENL
jgi:hypothetical protein